MFEKDKDKDEDENKKVSFLEKDKNQVESITEQEVLSNKLIIAYAIFFGLCVVIIFQALFSTYKMLQDKSIPIVTCPTEYNLDAPVVMKTLPENGPRTVDRWVRGFMRRFIISQFPRSKEDAKPFFEYVANHSTGEVQNKYQSFLDEIEDIGDFIKGGNYYHFYPKDSSDMRIRLVDGYTDRWVVEIEGYLIKKISNREERYTPTLKYTVEAGESNFLNPEGLYVIETDIEQITDFVAGNKKSLINN